MNDIKSLLSKLIGNQNTLSTSVLFIDFTGSHEKAQFLSQLFYWTPRSKIEGGWVCKSYDDWFEEIRVKEHTIRRAAKEFKNLGFLDYKTKKFNGIPKLHYKLDADKLIGSLLTFSQGRPLHRVRVDPCTESGSTLAQSQGPLTETTTENTTETTNNSRLNKSTKKKNFKKEKKSTEKVSLVLEEKKSNLPPVPDPPPLTKDWKHLSRLFDRLHEKIHKRKFDWKSPKELKAMKLLKDRLASAIKLRDEEPTDDYIQTLFTQILTYLFKNQETEKFIILKLSPSIILNQLNHLINSISYEKANSEDAAIERFIERREKRKAEEAAHEEFLRSRGL